MQNLAMNFLRCGVVYAVLGMALGIFMASSGDHGQAPTHAHLNLIGWASTGIFGLAYRAWPSLADGFLPKLHFWGWNLGVILIVVGLFEMFSGHMEFTVLTAIASFIVILSMLVFALVVFRAQPA